MLVAHRNLMPLQSKGNMENQSIWLVTLKSLSSSIMPEERQNKKNGDHAGGDDPQSKNHCHKLQTTEWMKK